MDSTNRSTDIKPRIVDEVSDKNKPWKMTEISNPTQCRSVKLPDTLPAAKVSVFRVLEELSFPSSM